MNYKKYILKNGLRVILSQQKDAPAVTVLVLVEAGSKYETKKNNGISHFLEHMVFKGTEKRPTALAVASELDGLGSSYNAFTSHEYTGYYAKAATRHAEKIFDVVSDMYLNPKFDADEIEKEKGVVIEELNMYEDMPPRKVADLFMQLLYGDQPAGWEIVGTKEILRALTRNDFVKYRGEHYVPSATSVTVSGNFDEKKMTAAIEDRFGGITDSKKFSKPKVVESQKKPEVFVKFKESDQTHLVLGARAFDLFDDRKYAIEILADILGGGMSSRLFQKVREELGAAYYVRASADLFTDHGFFSVSAGVEHSKLEVVIKAILAELQRVADGDFSEKDLRHGKDHLIGGLMLGLETSDSLAMFYGGQEVLEKEVMTAEEVVKKMEAVTCEEVIGVAKDIFQNEKLNMALIGPYKEKEQFEKILKF